MDPTTTFCPNGNCLPEAKRYGHYRYPFAEGAAVHLSRVRQNLQCHHRHGLLWLRTSAETVVIVVTLLVHGCPVQAIVAAFGFDERTVATRACSGRQGCRA